MEFTPEQQTFIDSLINKRVAEIKSKAEDKAKEDIAAAVALAEARHKEHAATLESKLAELNKKLTGGNAGNEDVTALKAEVEKLKAKDLKNAELARKAQLLTVAAELNAINGEQAATLVSPYIKSEDGTLTVINTEGQVRLNKEGKPMTVKEYMSEFLTGNPHLVKAPGNAGAGSEGSKFGGGAAPALLNMPPTDRITAARAAGIK